MEELCFAHVSDTHLISANSSDFLYRVQREVRDPLENLKNCLAALSCQKLDFLLLTGDLIHEGETEDYRALRNGNQLNFRTAGALREWKGANLPFSEGQEFRMYSHENIFYGIYRYDEVRGLLVPVKMFLPEEG